MNQMIKSEAGSRILNRSNLLSLLSLSIKQYGSNIILREQGTDKSRNSDQRICVTCNHYTMRP
jgi:hypothetical protein